MPFACLCFGGRPQSPGAEVVVKSQDGKQAATRHDAKEAGEQQRDAEPLIGTAVAVNEGAVEPAGEAQSPIEARPDAADAGLAAEGSAAPLLAGGGGGGSEAVGCGDGEGSAAGASQEDALAAEAAHASSSSDAQDVEGVAEHAGGLPDRAAVSGSAAAEEALAAEPSRSSSQGEPGSPGEEGSQAPLLPEEISLKAPRLSRLSALFSCSSSGAVADGGEQHAKQVSGHGPDALCLPTSVGQSRNLLLHALEHPPVCLSPTVPQAAQPCSAAAAAGGGMELQFEAAAAELVLLPRTKLLPLAAPEAALTQSAGLLAQQEAPALLAALLTLRRVAIHHHALLAASLEDVVGLLVECLHGGDAAAAQAAVMALLDLFVSYGNAMLRHCEPRLAPGRSALLALLLAAALGRTPAIRHWANEALRWAGAGAAPRMQMVWGLQAACG